MKNKVEINYLFEVSWEVCNKIGGIYTVLSTKAKTLQKLYKDKVIFIGPDVWSENNASPYFTETKTPLDSKIKSINLPEGVSIRTGRWDIPGKPVAVLVDFKEMFRHNNGLYGFLWENYGVDSLNAYGDYPEACAFSHASALVIRAICASLKTSGKDSIVHCDEWTTGATLLLLKKWMPEMASVFTTHATSIGRSICGNGKPLYDYLKGYNGNQMAYELNMVAKHTLEKAAAHNADCFTTVSDITAVECEQLLERKPDVVTPNGFEDNFVPAKSRFNEERSHAKKILLDTASALTGKTYDESTFLAATSGRCEFRNKGIDMFIDSMLTISSYEPQRNVVSFILVPAWSKEPRTDLGNGNLPEPYITHRLNNPDEDPVLGSLRWHNVRNDANTSVDIIYVPCYLNGKDGIFNTEYYRLLIGFDATIFPSYYEPWGYTPLESVAFGVPTVTTTLSGFGQYVLNSLNNSFASSGVEVVKRTDSNYHEAVHRIAEAVYSLIMDSPAEYCSVSKAARRTAGTAAWSYFIEYYIDAFEIALKNADNRN